MDNNHHSGQPATIIVVYALSKWIEFIQTDLLFEQAYLPAQHTLSLGRVSG